MPSAGCDDGLDSLDWNCQRPGGGMADAEDLKSSGDFSSCGFDSHPGHHLSLQVTVDAPLGSIRPHLGASEGRLWLRLWLFSDSRSRFCLFTMRRQNEPGKEAPP